MKRYITHLTAIFLVLLLTSCSLTAGQDPQDDAAGDRPDSVGDTQDGDTPSEVSDVVTGFDNGVYDPENGESTFSQDVSEINFVIDEIPTNSSKYVVLEMWDMTTSEMVSRICLTVENHATEIAQIEMYWRDLFIYSDLLPASYEQCFAESRFRAVAYMNGLQGGLSRGFRYLPDGDLDLWAVASGQDTDPFNPMSFLEGETLAKYLNQIMTDRMGIVFR
ncbi:MAG: hypothetical protein IJW40_00555 [Clostridia bacterium]|nr:hypothetical protein [Clostridia bacterium]